jgi:hypothetical protein
MNEEKGIRDERDLRNQGMKKRDTRWKKRGEEDEG